MTVPSTHELEHLQNAFNRLLEVGKTNSPTIDHLKRILMLRIVELEASEERPTLQLA